MRGASLRLAKWHRHADAVGAAIATRDWLTTRGSLTARLVASSKAFRVRRLHQKTVLCSLEEARAIGLPRRERVWEREVLLCCDGQPVVFGHTVVPMSATASDWPLFSALGERSLGTTLFYDPLVTRGPLEYARLRPGHPLLARLRAALGEAAYAAAERALDGGLFHARRCVYRRRQGLLMVTEVFLPAVLDLAGATIKNAK
ncbi:chorismate lyase [Massilia sp. Se16.2.3]|uniref:chorismate--pyruvate lyase family protein n=1 Tax=Massilia sp. Se16.2.3 TaxID=2709303 RepID=UPI0015FFC040|nr:chorismate lyase [Massilia sp. Se16.2.3]QNA97640.1 chorismate lyase [Massilia sp. Se16.2.3]